MWECCDVQAGTRFDCSRELQSRRVMTERNMEDQGLVEVVR